MKEITCGIKENLARLATVLATVVVGLVFVLASSAVAAPKVKVIEVKEIKPEIEVKVVKPEVKVVKADSKARNQAFNRNQIFNRNINPRNLLFNRRLINPFGFGLINPLELDELELD